MPTSLLPSFRRQQLVLDFASILPHLPEGIYLSLSSSNSALWSGVLFVRHPGPYESLIARFIISFPSTYPETAPLVTFETDIFHPLIVPLTTYTSSGAGDSTGVSAGDVESRLPPGAFSLRHGFPHWFDKSRAAVRPTSTSSLDNAPSATSPPSTPTHPSSPTADPHDPPTQAPHFPTATATSTTTLALLTHIHASFTNPPPFLDALPLSTAPNPSAWHAWRSYRGLAPPPPPPPTVRQQQSSSSPRHPSDWKWDGVFESRVREAVENSINEATLYGYGHYSSAGAGAGGNIAYAYGGNLSKPAQGQGHGEAQIRFEKLDTEKLEEIRSELRQGS